MYCLLRQKTPCLGVIGDKDMEKVALMQQYLGLNGKIDVAMACNALFL